MPGVFVSCDLWVRSKSVLCLTFPTLICLFTIHLFIAHQHFLVTCGDYRKQHQPTQHYAWLWTLVQAVNRTSGRSGSASVTERGSSRSRTTLGSTPTTPGGSHITASPQVLEGATTRGRSSVPVSEWVSEWVYVTSIIRYFSVLPFELRWYIHRVSKKLCILFAISCIFCECEILRLIGRKSRNFYTPPVFSAAAGSDPVEISWRCLMLVKLDDWD